MTKKKVNNSYYKLVILEYIRRTLTPEEFEVYLKEVVPGSGFAKLPDVIKFMRKEIFPLKRENIQWCITYFDRNMNEVNYNTILKKLKP